MIILGVLGIIQVLFLPGILLLRYFPKAQGFWTNSAMVVGLSLIANYLIVFFSTTLGIFSQVLVLVIFGVELVLLYVWYGKRFSLISIGDLATTAWNALTQPLVDLFHPLSEEENQPKITALKYVLSLILFIGSIIAIEWIFRFTRYNLGQIFNTWDAVNSWNKWATQWFSGQFPTGTEDYPQLFPANWAMIYAFIGTSVVQFFSKAIMPIFSLLIMLVLLSFGIRHKNPGYFAAIMLLRLIFKKFLVDYISSGYMDIPLAFFSLMAVIFLLMITKETDQHKRYAWFLLAVVFAAGASVVKQAGLFILLTTSLIGFTLYFRLLTRNRLKIAWRQLLPILLLILIIVMPWYAIKNIQFLSGTDQSHLEFLKSNRNQIKNEGSIIKALQFSLNSLGRYQYLFFLMLPLLLVLDRFWRTIVLAIILPYSLIWSLFASYDVRNLALVFPLLSIVIGLGLWSLFEKLHALLAHVKIGRARIIYLILILMLMTSTAAIVLVDNDLLIERQKALQKQLFSPGLNEKLMTFLEDKPDNLSIMTNYPIDQIPGISANKVNFTFDNLEDFLSRIEGTTIDYILYPASAHQSIIDHLEAGIDKGIYTVILSDPGWIPYTMVGIED